LHSRNSILGAIYVIGPLAFRMSLPARGRDHVTFAGFAVPLDSAQEFNWTGDELWRV
jgi:hypothetical protein